MQVRVNKNNVVKQPKNYAALMNGGATGVWDKEETHAEKRLNHIVLTREPSSRLAKSFDA